MSPPIIDRNEWKNLRQPEAYTNSKKRRLINDYSDLHNELTHSSKKKQHLNPKSSQVECTIHDTRFVAIHLITGTGCSSSCGSDVEIRLPSTPKSKSTLETKQKASQAITELEKVVPIKENSTAKIISPSTKITKSAVEKEMNGAPEGDLFRVSVRKRTEFEPSSEVKKESEFVRSLCIRKKKLRLDNPGVRNSAEKGISWATEYDAVDSLRCFAIHHPEHASQLIGDALIELVCPAVVSLRSVVSRNALLCIQDLVLSLKNEIEPYYDEIVPLLLKRSGSEKHFIRDLARKVLESIADTSTSAVLIKVLLQAANNKDENLNSSVNAQSVGVAGLLVSRCIKKMDNTLLRGLILNNSPQVLEHLTTFLNCKVIDCKAATRHSLQHIRQVLGDTIFLPLVMASLSGSSQVDVIKASETTKKWTKETKTSIRERMRQTKQQVRQVSPS